MARPKREGLDYFPLVTSFDEKVELIIAEFGSEGLGIIIGLYQRIYTNGYYMNWNKDTLMLFATKYINTEKTRVNAVLIQCFERNIFNKELYDSYGILTSRGIQKQYLKVCKDSRRKIVQFIKEYCLIENDELFEVITELTSINTEETPENDVLSTQRERESKEKVKESKKKEKVKELKSPVVSNSSDKTIEACKYFESAGFGTINQIVMQKMEDLVTRFSFQWVKDAIDTSVIRGKRKLSYVEGILINWRTEGREENKIGNNGQNRNSSKSAEEELREQGIGL